MKTVVLFADVEDFAAVNAAYARQAVATAPGGSTVPVTRLGGARVEIEAIAHL
jgi:enamine deaminase RidA (YjgF/YER057c/UK114 family)